MDFLIGHIHKSSTYPMRNWQVDLLKTKPVREGYKYGLTYVDTTYISVQESIERIGQAFIYKKATWEATIKDHIY